jgi:hypothetical protein
MRTNLEVARRTFVKPLSPLQIAAALQAVKRNIGRFPEEFMFQLTRDVAELSRLQSAILNSGRGQNIKYSRSPSRSTRPWQPPPMS